MGGPGQSHLWEGAGAEAQGLKVSVWNYFQLLLVLDLLPGSQRAIWTTMKETRACSWSHSPSLPALHLSPDSQGMAGMARVSPWHNT